VILTIPSNGIVKIMQNFSKKSCSRLAALQGHFRFTPLIRIVTSDADFQNPTNQITQSFSKKSCAE